MNRLARFARELVGLFVDDWRVTVAILAWLAVVAFALPRIVPSLEARSALMFAGFASILVASVAITARERLQ